MGERLGEGREFYPEETLEDCLRNPEIADELSSEECEQLLALAQAKIAEIYEPNLKAKYKAIVQRILQQYTKTAYSTHKPQINISDSYNINTQNGSSTMSVNICAINNFHQTNLIGIHSAQIVRHESYGYLCTITDKEHRFWINLKLFILKQRDGTELRILFIADWYVIPGLRDNKIGTQLQQLAQKIGKDNRCSTLFCVLIPENPHDLERLKSTNQKMGYQINDVDGAVVAQKSLT